jgi:RND family efflux transporter MFP subunit
MRRWSIATAIGFVVILVGAAGYFTSQGTPPPTSTPPPATVPVTRGAVEQLVTASGKLVNARRLTLSMGANGPLAKLNVRPGDRVHAGDVLAELSTTELEQQVAQAEQTYLLQQLAYSNTLQPDAQAVAAAQSAVNSAQAAYQAARQKYGTNQDQVMLSCINVQNAADAVGAARDSYEAIANDLRGWIQDEIKGRRAMLNTAENMYEAEVARCNLARNIVSDSSLRSAQAQVLEAQRTLSNLISPTTTSLITARADLESARLSLEAARRELAHVTIVAPFGGVVLEVKNRVGDTVIANAAVIIMADPQALEVQASISERDFTVVETSQATQLLFDARPEIRATGRVTRIVPERLSGGQVLYPISVTFDDLPDGLAADMSVDVAIAIADKADVLRLPRAVVRARSDNTAQVQVWANDHSEQRTVKIGLRGDRYVEIVDGLQEGDLVVSQ